MLGGVIDSIDVNEIAIRGLFSPRALQLIGDVHDLSGGDAETVLLMQAEQL